MSFQRNSEIFLVFVLLAGTVAVSDVYTTVIDTKVNYIMRAHARTSPRLPRELAEIQPNSLSMSVSIKTADEGRHNSHRGQRANTSITQWMKGHTSHAHASPRPIDCMTSWVVLRHPGDGHLGSFL